MPRLLASLARPNRAFAVALALSILIAVLAGNGIAVLVAAFTLLQIGVVTAAVAFLLILVGVFSEGLTR